MGISVVLAALAVVGLLKLIGPTLRTVSSEVCQNVVGPIGEREYPLELRYSNCTQTLEPDPSSEDQALAYTVGGASLL
jgi:hypothetical protein